MSFLNRIASSVSGSTRSSEPASLSLVRTLTVGDLVHGARVSHLTSGEQQATGGGDLEGGGTDEPATIGAGSATQATGVADERPVATGSGQMRGSAHAATASQATGPLPQVQGVQPPLPTLHAAGSQLTALTVAVHADTTAVPPGSSAATNDNIVARLPDESADPVAGTAVRSGSSITTYTTRVHTLAEPASALQPSEPREPQGPVAAAPVAARVETATQQGQHAATVSLPAATSHETSPQPGDSAEPAVQPLVHATAALRPAVMRHDTPLQRAPEMKSAPRSLQPSAAMAASIQPVVHIGSIEVIVEAPTEPRAAPAAPWRAASFASRHYLRGL
jgi:hypothetical protein